MARPTKRTPEIETKLAQAFSLGSTIASACYHAGIAESTYFSWCEKDSEFMEQNKALREKPVLKALQTVAADLDNPLTAKWYLERKHPEFKPRNQTKHVTDDGKGGDAPMTLSSILADIDGNTRGLPSEQDKD